MAPKRKRADEPVATEEAAASSSTRTTRRTTRSSAKSEDTITSETSNSTKATKQPRTTKAAASKKTTAKTEDDGDGAPAPKKAKTSAKGKTTTSKTSKAKKGEVRDDVDAGNNDAPREQSTGKVNGTKSQAANTQSEAEPYTPVNALTLFGKYADASEPDVIGPEGFEALCKDASISMEGVQPLMMAWQMGAKEMAKFTKDEWTKGTSTLKVSSLPALRTALSELEDLLILDKPVVKQSKTEPYNRASYWQYSKDRKATFHELYNFCFALAKSEQSRNLDMEIAAALWSVLLPPKYPIMTEVLAFINEKESYRAANKDLWVMMLEFLETVKPTLEDYDEGGGAWPTLLDDFVEWKRAQNGASSS